MFNVKAFISSLISLAKRYPLLLGLFLVIVVVFVSAPFVFVYNAIRGVLPASVQAKVPVA